MIWLLIGFIVGFFIGLAYYAKVLDKPETIQKINKQKVRIGGIFRNIFKSKKEKR